MVAHRTIHPYALYTLATLCGFLALFCTGSAPAATVLDSRMPFDSPVAGNQNGWQLDVHSGTAIVGGPGNYSTGVPSGWAQIFYNNPSAGWEHQATLTSDMVEDPTLGDGEQFGFGVAIDQNMAVVSAYQNSTVYVFRRQGVIWTEDTMAGLSMLTINQFGSDVGVSDERIIVGSGTGAAYIYAVNSGEWNGTEISSGSSVGISGENAIVGDSAANTAYLYHFNGSEWEEEEAVSKSGGSFGSSVRIFGDYAIVGSPAADVSTGTAAIYRRDGETWIEEATLTASDGAVGDEFGNSVDIGENYAIVGASGAWIGDGYSQCGVSYIFQRNDSTWTEIEKLVPYEEVLYDCDLDAFGSAVAIDDNGDNADYIVGAYLHDDNEYNENIGTAYIHQRDMLKTLIPGDADLDDDVDEDDAAILADHWLDNTDVAWREGDFNADGIVDDADATLMATNWHFGVGPAASVPEPATFVLLAFGGLCLLATAASVSANKVI